MENTPAHSNTAVPKDVLKLARFFSKHLPPWRAWGFSRIVDYLSWYWSQGLCVVIRDGEKILAACLLRRVPNVQDGGRYYYHKDNGECLWVDACAVDDPNAWELLEQIRETHFSSATSLGFFRLANEEHPRCYRPAIIRRLIRRHQRSSKLSEHSQKITKKERCHGN